jgi:cytochrome P450
MHLGGWTRQRKFANAIMRESERAIFHRYPELEAKRMLVELIEEPGRYNHALESFVSRVTCRLAWGHSEASDELKQRARELLIGVSPTGALGNKVPFLMSLPDWLIPAKAWERRRAATERRWFEIMQGEVEADMRKKKAPQSWMRMYLEDKLKWGFKYALEGAYCVGMHGIAGALTIAAPMQTFCLAMCYYPQFLPMLHEELDRVCGDRLPRSEDRPNLPFLRAVIRECLRWRPPVPTGIPHYLSEDDEWNGYHIPKGSTIHPLEWYGQFPLLCKAFPSNNLITRAIARDPELFPEPEVFNPLRWVTPGYPTYREPLSEYPTIINSTQFGYGRRICQGQTVADEDLLIGLGSVAWLFNIALKNEDNIPSVNHSGHNKPEKREGIALGMSIELPNKLNGLTLENIILNKYKYPGSFPVNGEPASKVVAIKSRKSQEPESRAKVEESKSSKGKSKHDSENIDPTLDFTTLLIAKPLPFKFNLTPRDERRVAIVRKLYTQGVRNGEFTDSREYWGPNQGRNQPLGWGKV